MALFMPVNPTSSRVRISAVSRKHGYATLKMTAAIVQTKVIVDQVYQV